MSKNDLEDVKIGKLIYFWAEKNQNCWYFGCVILDDHTSVLYLTKFKYINPINTKLKYID